MASAGKLLLILIVLFALGFYILPSTISLFAGEHVWYYIGNQGNDIPCEKCHADVAEEVASSPHHSALTCEHCHRGVNITYASDYGGDVYGGKEAHAASILSCLICHSGYRTDSNEAYNHSHYEYPNTDCNLCHNGPNEPPPPTAGGFGLTGQSGDTGEYAAHKSFVLKSRNSKTLFDSNEACIACHTQIKLGFNYTTPRVMDITVTESYSQDGKSVSWNWAFKIGGNITYRIHSDDRTVAGAVVSTTLDGG